MILLGRRAYTGWTLVSICSPPRPSFEILPFKVYEKLNVRGEEDETRTLRIIEFTMAGRAERHSVVDIGERIERKETSLSV